MSSALYREVRLVGLELHEMGSGGDCLPLALADQLGLPRGQEGAMVVRRAIAECLMRDHAMFQGFVGDNLPPAVATLLWNEDWEGYVDHIKRPGIHLGEFELNAACRAFNVHVHVISEGFACTFKCIDAVDTPVRTLFLAYQQHAREYQSLRLPGSSNGPSNVPEYHARPHSADCSKAAKERRAELRHDGGTSALFEKLPSDAQADFLALELEGRGV